ncbi:MAG: hypothetical protein A2798_02555 [Candidatus Levybacteria bacterium RIFCSPHIGHO2_01_FULL_37_17]|nr:MAG: hypothetical protein A2798_02555 [Candidatus Levybacteria bacterium RIFCSPHIGHO2_01_FULL_37_17]OGH36749.1 MAG: hypothetical protein A2959_00545 [Candidatus Levybacteria bacterium RIFCSPLOWO2_01_FULL_38_23]
MKWYVYILKCKDSSLYTGITTNVNRRINEHNSKKGAKSLLGKLPVKLLYNEVFDNQIKAAKREREIKGWRRERKLELVKRVYPEKVKPLKGR